MSYKNFDYFDESNGAIGQPENYKKDVLLIKECRAREKMNHNIKEFVKWIINEAYEGFGGIDADTLRDAFLEYEFLRKKTLVEKRLCRSGDSNCYCAEGELSEAEICHTIREDLFEDLP